MLETANIRSKTEHSPISFSKKVRKFIRMSVGILCWGVRLQVASFYVFVAFQNFSEFFYWKLCFIPITNMLYSDNKVGKMQVSENQKGTAKDQ